MEVAIPRPGLDFDFNEARPMAYLSAPSTPKRFGDYSFLSAPSSPSRAAELYSYFEELSREEEEEEEEKVVSLATTTRVPFDWEEKPGTPKSPKEEEFAFNFSSEMGKASPLSTADELFHGGKIKPLRPPPGLKLELHQDDSFRSPLISRRPSSPRSPIARGKRIIKEALSPRGKKGSELLVATTQKGEGVERGRERVSGPGRSSSRKGSRSLSPYRVSGYPWEEEEEEMAKQQAATKLQPTLLDSRTSISSSSSSSSKSSSKKWNLKDLLLFRSASEGRSSDKDPLRKYSAATLFRTRKIQNDQDVKNSSFRSTDSGSGSPAKASRRKAPASAHELHYTINKAASENLKKKSFLPYRYGLLGRLAFNPTEYSLSK